MNHCGHFLCKELLKLTALRCLCVLSDRRIDLLLGEHGEDLDVFLCVRVRYVEPELVELIWRRALRIQPDVSLLSLSELSSVSLCDQRAGECESLLAEDTADELGTCGDVSPLVCSTHLQGTSLVLIEIEEVISLKKLVGELGERHSVAGLA